jgi:hypothetical protein
VQRDQARRRTGAWLFPALLIATLAQNYFDLDAILSGELPALYTYEGPIVLKLGKDFIYLTLLALALVHARRTRRSPLRDLGATVLFVIATMALLSAARHGVEIAAIGLRWALPFVLFFLMRDWVAGIDGRAASRWLLAGMAICFAAQVYQLFNMPPVFGEVLPGIPARTPGIFIAPNSAAFFACASAAAVLVFRTDSRSLRGVAVAGALLISLLAQSGTGLIVATVLALWWAAARVTPIFWPLAIVTFAVAFLNLDRLTQRDDYVELSGGGRLEVLADVTGRAALSVDNFGLFTNAANLRSQNPEDKVAIDSLVASWIGNFGLMALPMLVLIGLFVAYRMREVDPQRAFPCIVTFVLFSLTSIVFEAFPMNLLLIVGIWAARRTPPALHTLTMPVTSP